MKIQTRIILWITSAGVLVSLIFSLIVFYEMSEQIYRQMDNELKATIRSVFTIVDNKEIREKKEYPLITDYFFGNRHYWIKVWRDKQLIYTSKLARIIELPVDFQQKKTTASITIPKTTINLHQDSRDEVTFRIRRATIPAELTRPAYRIQAAIPMEKIDEEIIEVALIIFFGLTLSCLLLLCISFFLANRILKPIREITDLAQEITGKDLAARIPLGPSRDELYDLASALNQMLDRLQFSFTRQKEFIANAAHELNTPTANLRLFVEQGINNQSLPENFRNDLVRQHEILLRSGRLLRNLMVLSTLELKQTIKPETFDFTKLITSVVADFQPLLECREIPLRVAMPESLTVFGDQEQLRRVLVNLIENAVKYNTDTAEITIELKKTKHTISLEISNGSPPIPENDLKQLFEQFYRIEKSRSQEFGGCGLGLTIVREIINLHAGTIQIKNEASARVRIIVELPDKM
jgi:signal transduction histidine kinase